MKKIVIISIMLMSLIGFSYAGYYQAYAQLDEIGTDDPDPDGHTWSTPISGSFSVLADAYGSEEDAEYYADAKLWNGDFILWIDFHVSNSTEDDQLDTVYTGECREVYVKAYVKVTSENGWGSAHAVIYW